MVIWDPRQSTDPTMLEHLLKKFVAEAAAEEVIRIGVMYGMDRDRTDHIAKAVELAVRSTVTRTFPEPRPKRQRADGTADTWLWNTLEDKLGSLEMLVIKGHYEHEKKRDSRVKTTTKKTKKQRQAALKKLSAFFNEPDHRLQLTSRVYLALMTDLQQSRGSKLAGLTPSAFLRELKRSDGGVVGRVSGIGPQALGELRDIFNR